MTESTTSAASSKRRVRTGCLTCRRRRRKCPEEKPVCSNCKDKNLQCRYGVQVVFIDAGTGEREHMPDPPRARKSDDTDTGTTRQHKTQSPVTGPDAVGSSNSTERGKRSKPLTITSVHNSPLTRPSASWAPKTGDVQDQGSRLDESEQARNEEAFGNDAFATSSTSQLAKELSSPATVESPLVALPWSPPTQQVPHTRTSDTAFRDDMELLVYYRYRIAPTLDLGIGGLFFGIAVSIAAARDNALKLAVLALSTTHGGIDMPEHLDRLSESASRYARAASEAALTSSPDYRCIVFALLSWRCMLESSPEAWLHVVRNTSNDLQLINTGIKPEIWQVMARITIAAALLSPEVDCALEIPSQGSTGQQLSWEDSNLMSPNYQHNTSLQLLHRSLKFLPSAMERQRAVHYPVVSAWQACWSEVQMWYSLRVQDLRHILEIPATEDATVSIDGVQLHPVIMFSNACALHSNIYHHLTAIILLRNKPRLVRPVSEAESSVSLIWHALRIVGIVAHASKAAISDPIIMAALVVVMQVISHDAQKTQAARLLVQVARLLGPKAQTFVSHLGFVA